MQNKLTTPQSCKSPSKLQASQPCIIWGSFLLPLGGPPSNNGSLGEPVPQGHFPTPYRLQRSLFPPNPHGIGLNLSSCLFLFTSNVISQNPTCAMMPRRSLDRRRSFQGPRRTRHRRGLWFCARNQPARAWGLPCRSDHETGERVSTTGNCRHKSLSGKLRG